MTQKKNWSKINTLSNKIQNKQSTIINNETNAMLFLKHNFIDNPLFTEQEENPNQQQNSIPFTSKTEISDLTMKNKNTSPGINGIRSKMLKKLSNDHVSQTSKHFKKAWKDMVVPTTWKEFEIMDKWRFLNQIKTKTI